jgi:hypothetical protein
MKNKSPSVASGGGKTHPGCQMRQGTTLQAAEKLDLEGGGGFNPRIKPAESTRALAPEGRYTPISPQIPSFSVASFVVP